MKIAIIGCGVIGSALARHFSKKSALVLYDRTLAKSQALAKEVKAEAVDHMSVALLAADLIILAIKPKDLKNFAKDAGALLTSTQILVSVLGSTSVATLRHYFEQPLIVRCLPNIPMVCGEGVIGFVEHAELKEKISLLFKGLGLLVWLEENKLEALSALAGSGPAFVYVLIEAMIESGVFLGFSAQEAQDLVLQTMEGSIQLLKKTGSLPAALKLKVASPGGTTISGLKTLEEGGVRAALMATFQATYQKSQDMQHSLHS